MRCQASKNKSARDTKPNFWLNVCERQKLPKQNFEGSFQNDWCAAWRLALSLEQTCGQKRESLMSMTTSCPLTSHSRHPGKLSYSNSFMPSAIRHLKLDTSFWELNEKLCGFLLLLLSDIYCVLFVYYLFIRPIFFHIVCCYQIHNF